MATSKAEVEFQRSVANDFPRLAVGNFKITSPKDVRYNCIAWAAGSQTEWWWPLGKYWPGGGPKSTTVDSFLMMYCSQGFSECANGELEIGFEKIALYANAHGQVTHAARQLPDGQWTSKLGRNHDISHTLTSLEGGAYGKVAKMLKRALSASA
jgi:hypothetical protein